MANLLSNTTIGGYQSIHTGNIGSYALTSLPSHNHDDRYFTESESDARFQPLENQRLSTGNSPSFASVSANDVYTTGGWFRNHTNNAGIYWSNTGWHLMPENSSDFRFHSGNNTEAAIRMESSGTTRGYVYVNSSNEIGFLNNDRNWRLRVYSGGAVESYGDFRAPIFYDSANTGYYGDFASTSNLYKLQLGGGSEILGLLGMGSSYWYGMGITNAYTAVYSHFQGNGVQLGSYNGTTFVPKLTVGNDGNVEAVTSFKAPIFYDSADNGYYLDPNGLSVLSHIRLNNNWANAGINQGAINIRGQYPSMQFRNTVSDSMWLRHMDGSGTIQHYYASDGVDSSNWSIKHSMHGNGNFSSVGTHTASQFNGSGAGLTGTASSLSVSYATTAGALSSMNISQFTNNSGYITGYTETDTLASVTGRGATTASQVSFTKTDDHAISVGTIRGRAVGVQGGEFIQLYERVNIGGPSGWGASNTSAPTQGLSVYGGATIGYGTSAGLTVTGTTNVVGTLNATRYTLSGTGAFMEGYGSYSSKLGRVAIISFDWNANYDDSTNHGIMSTSSDGSFSDNISINSFNDITLRLDANNNNTESYLRIMNNTSGTNTIAHIGYNGANGVASFSRDLYVNGGTGGNFGNRIVVGADSTPYTLQDGNIRPTVYVTGAYPVLALNHTVTGNTSHGPTVQFTFDGLSQRQWVIGCGGAGEFMDFGFSNSTYGNTNWNPHNGIAGYQGNTIMRIIDNAVGIGGDWGAHGSGGNPAYTLDVRGTIYSSADMRAPIFYDTADTGYYGDFASTSVMNSIRFGTSTNNGTLSGAGDWGMRFTTDAGYITFGPANGSYAHIYTDRGTFYFNKDLLVNGNTVLTTANYNSYSPTLTGGNASGTWSINVTGSAGSASTAGSATNLSGTGGSSIQSTSTGTSYTANYQIRENAGGGGNTNEIYAPQLAFHWGGVVASSIMMESSGRMAIRNNPGGSYENFIAAVIYSSGYGDSTQWNTAYSWGNHASAGYLTSLPSHNHDDRYYTESESDSRYLYYRGYSTSGNTQNFQSTANTIRFDQVGALDNGAWSNQPTGYYTYGGILSLRGASFGLQIYGSHTGDLAFKTQWDNDQYSGWRTIISSANIGSQSVSYASTAGSAPANGGNSSTVGGYSVSVAGTANTIPTRNSSGYLIPENWIQLNGNYGLYSPTNNAHLRPNSGTYGSWLIIGSRNGYGGIEFETSNGNLVLMISTDSNSVGFHNNSYGWQTLWQNGTLYVYKNSYGGGTQATVLDSSNYSSWAQPIASAINTGNIGSQSVSYATSAQVLSSTNYIIQRGSNGSWNADFQATPAGSLSYGGDLGANGTNGPGGSWWIQQNFRHTNASNYWGTQVAWGWEDNANRLATRNITGGSYGAWVYYLNSSNFTSYAPSLTGSGASGSWGISVTGSAGSVAWTNVSSRPTALSQFTNDLGNYGGWITSSGSISGNAATATIAEFQSIPDQRGNAYTPNAYTGQRIWWHFNNKDAVGGYGDYWHAIQTVNPWTTFDASHRQQQIQWGGTDISFRYATSGTAWSSWFRFITDANIGSQSVNYANSAGSASTAGSATSASQLTKYGDIYGDNWNTYYVGGKLIVSAALGMSGANKPPTSYEYGVALSYGESGGPLMQMYFPENSGNIGTIFRKGTYRTGWNGNWSTWKTFVEQEGNLCTIVGGNGTGLEVHGNVGYNQDPLTYFLLRGQADTSWKALKIRLTGDAGGQDIEFRRIAENTTDSRMFYIPRGANTVNFDYPIVQPSDSRLKDNITPISTPVDKIKSLRGVEFDWNSGEQVGTHDVGLIAQDVEAVLPEAVTTQEDGYKNLAYTKVIPLLVEAMKEQQKMIEALRAEIDLLKTK